MNLFVPNLTFEDELGGRTITTTPQTLRAVSELAPLMGHLVVDGDTVFVPVVPNDEDLPESLKHVRWKSVDDLPGESRQLDATLVPWGWTDTLRELIPHGLSTTVVPPSQSVWEVNSRSFNAVHDLIATDGPEGLPPGYQYFGRLHDDVDAWQGGVQQLQQRGFERWVTKTQISHAGRHRLIGQGIELNAQQQGWLNKQIQQPGGVYLEPWVNITEEVGLQFDISGNSAKPDIRFAGVASLLNDVGGRYRGSLIAMDDRLQMSWEAAIEHGHAVCRAAAAIGYLGPLGIDAYRFRLPNGQLVTRLCNDINGRFTMGRVALHLRKWLEPNEFGLWVHFVESNTPADLQRQQEILTKLRSEDVRTVETSPVSIAGQPVRQRTVLLIGQSCQDLLQVAHKLQSRKSKVTET